MHFLVARHHLHNPGFQVWVLNLFFLRGGISRPWSFQVELSLVSRRVVPRRIPKSVAVRPTPCRAFDSDEFCGAWSAKAKVSALLGIARPCHDSESLHMILTISEMPALSFGFVRLRSHRYPWVLARHDPTYPMSLHVMAWVVLGYVGNIFSSCLIFGN